MTNEKVRALRKKLGMSQAQFWTPIGVTQSGGSRYESDDRNIPAPVQRLLYLVYDHHILQHLSARETKHYLALGK